MKVIQRPLSFLLIVLVLVSTLNLELSRMICLHSGRVQTSFKTLKDCCPDKPVEGQFQLKARCCAIDNAGLVVRDSHVVSRLTAELSPASVALFLNDAHLFFKHSVFANTKTNVRQVFLPDDDPSLSRLCTLRI